MDERPRTTWLPPAPHGAPEPVQVPTAASPPPRGPGPEGRDGWPWWAPLLGLFTVVFAATVLSVVGIAIAYAVGATSEGEDAPAGVTIPATVAQNVLFVLVAFAMARVFGGRARPDELGFRVPKKLLQALGIAVLAYVGYLVLSGIYASLFDLPEQDDLPGGLGGDQSTAALVAIAVMVCVFAPIGEEVFFRGFAFPAFRNGFARFERTRAGAGWWGAIAGGVLFGVIHLAGTDPPYVVALAIFGFVLCVLYWKTGSLYPCMALHAVNNSIAFGVTQDLAAGEVLALTVGSLATVALVTAPLLRAGLREPVAA